MRRSLYLSLALCLSATIFGFAQNLRFPRDPEKLQDRVQKFWAATISNQRVRSLDFILPEKRDLFLAEIPLTVKSATFIGVDLGPDANQAAVRMSLEVFAGTISAATLTLNRTNKWVWKNGNWYLDVDQVTDIFPRGNSGGQVTSIGAKTRDQISKSFQLLNDSIDVGRLIAGESKRIEIPIQYSGELPLTAGVSIPNPLLDLESGPDITSRTNHIVLLVSTGNYEGPFTFPLPLKIGYEDATIERTLLVKGEVFVPLAFRQSPANIAIALGSQFSVFMRNNTDDTIELGLILVDAKLDIVKRPDRLLAHEEGEVVFKLRPVEGPPDEMLVTLKKPIQGRDTFTYRFRYSKP